MVVCKMVGKLIVFSTESKVAVVLCARVGNVAHSVVFDLGIGFGGNFSQC